MGEYDVVLADHRPRWADMAGDESKRIASALGDLLVVTHHIGSTAVAGLRAKPIIDLMPVVEDLRRLDEQRGTIEALGYEWRGATVFEDARYCVLHGAGKQRLFQLHICPVGHPEIERHVRFRDFLRAHEVEARAYEAEKERARALHPLDSVAYNEEKSDWIKAADVRAARWASRQSGLRRN
jgi:GrpB-like predicted nucleotidyltransferase (UPF0157 family)